MMGESIERLIPGNLFRLGVAAICAACLALNISTASGQGRALGIERGPVTLPALTERASLIVRGAVIDSEVAWIGRTIYTGYDLTVTETIKGNVRKQVKMWVPGGATAQVRTVWPGAPDFEQSDEVIFFAEPLERARDRGSRSRNTRRPNDGFTPVGLFDGAVRVETESATGNKVVRARGRPEDVELFLSEVRDLARGQRGGR